MSQETDVTWLPKEAYDRLSRELEELSGPGRIEIAKRIEQAREEGDLKENGGYHAAKEEQGKMEARIRQLTQLLRHAEVRDAAPADGHVASGTVVTATIAGTENRFLLGNREIAGDSDLDVYSEHSPLGAAILGATIGETRTYTAPNGRSIQVEVVDVQPYTG
jgi:transcription elongation factor GreA